MDQAGVSFELCSCKPLQGNWKVSKTGYAHFDRQTIAEEEVSIAEVTLANGLSALSNLNCALELARDGIIDAITFGPFNKAALIEAGLGHEDELHYMAEFLEWRPIFLSEYAGRPVDQPSIQPHRPERGSRLHHRASYFRSRPSDR